MEVRFLNESDYDSKLVGWWEEWGWIPPSKEMLPENSKCGVMISSNDEDVCAGFLYFTNSKMAWIEYIVSNKNYKKNDRAECIEMLINVLSKLAKEKGFNYIYASIKNTHLIKKYEKCGFIKGDGNCQELIKVWQQ